MVVLEWEPGGDERPSFLWNGLHGHAGTWSLALREVADSQGLDSG